MKKVLLATSAILFGISPTLRGETLTGVNLETKNFLCISSLRVKDDSTSLNNYLLAQQPVDPVYLGPSTGPESNCTYYIVRGKDGKIYDCRKCTYGGPYCFRRE